MGGTLPAVVRAVQRPGDPNRRNLGLLYAMNTLGSVGGVMPATLPGHRVVGYSPDAVDGGGGQRRCGRDSHSTRQTLCGHTAGVRERSDDVRG